MKHGRTISTIITDQLPLLYSFAFIFMTSLLFILLSTGIVYSFQVKLAWDANTEPDLAGYYLYYKTDPSALYSDQNKITIPDPNATFWPVPGLNDMKTYYFVLTAYDTSGLESAASNREKVYVRNALPGDNLIINGNFSDDDNFWTHKNDRD